MLHTERCIILFSIFNFEIIIDSQEVVKIVQRVLRFSSSSFFSGYLWHNYSTVSNQDTDTGALCLYSAESFYHTCKFM